MSVGVADQIIEDDHIPKLELILDGFCGTPSQKREHIGKIMTAMLVFIL